MLYLNPALVAYHFHFIQYYSSSHCRILIGSSYDLLEDRHTIDVIITKFFFLHFEMAERCEN